MVISIVDMIIVVLYLMLMVAIAFFFAKRKIKNFDDYFLAGGKLPAAVLIATLTSTYFGTDSLMGDAEMGFGLGISGFFSYCFIAAILLIVLAFVGGKIKEKLGDTRTVVEIIGSTYGPVSRMCAAIGSLAYTTPIVNIMAMGIAFKIALGMEFWVGVLIAGIIATVHTYYGGLVVVSIADTINFAFISIGIAIIGLVAWNFMGTDNILQGLENFAGGDPSYFFQPTGGWLTGGLMVTYAVTALSVLCEPTLFQRIFAAASGKDVRKALIIAAIIYAAYSIVATFVGILAAAGVGLGTLGEIRASEAMISLAIEVLPVGVLGLFLAGFLAGGLSTCDSMLLVAGGNLAYDIYKPLSKKEISDEKMVKHTKRGVLIISALSVLLCFAFGRLMSAWTFVASLLCNTTLVPLYTALFLKGKKSRLAGEISALFGLVGTFGMYFGIYLFGYYDDTWATRMFDVDLFGNIVPIWQEYNILIILPLTAIVYFVVHLITQPNKKASH
ncbi:MAG: sodium:solute symporter family protein [Lentihominibacter sp.]|jgi:SSS family solute:Na+ symporter